MIFQASNQKRQHFLKLFDNNNNSLELLYSKDETWFKYFGHSDSLCTCTIRAIVNYASINEYRLRFFPWEDFMYSCSFYPIETRHYILHKYRRYNEYWNLRRDTISHFILFLEFNSSTFTFSVNIT